MLLGATKACIYQNFVKLCYIGQLALQTHYEYVQSVFLDQWNFDITRYSLWSERYLKQVVQTVRGSLGGTLKWSCWIRFKQCLIRWTEKALRNMVWSANGIIAANNFSFILTDNQSVFSWFRRGIWISALALTTHCNIHTGFQDPGNKYLPSWRCHFWHAEQVPATNINIGRRNFTFFKYPCLYL